MTNKPPIVGLASLATMAAVLQNGEDHSRPLPCALV